jgi:putative two-component system response regulator
MENAEPNQQPVAPELRDPGSGFHVPEIEEVSVFVVDDDRMSLTLMQSVLERIGHPVQAFSDPRAALKAIRENPPAVLVTDLVMPEMTGLELAEQARIIEPGLEVIVATAYGDEDTAASALGLGLSSFMSKPIERDRLARAVQRAFLKRAGDAHHRGMVKWMYAALARNADQIREVTLGTLSSLINAVDARSAHFRGHSQAVAMQAAAVAQALGLPDEEIEYIRTAGLLHDIGMIGVPDALIEKVETLTPPELELIRSHCETGGAIIEPMQHLGPSRQYVCEHHERWDGSGYPDQKKGQEISLGGQIVGIAEAWTGIVESRAYRDGRSREEGYEILLKHQGEWFTEELTTALIESDVGVLG